MVVVVGVMQEMGEWIPLADIGGWVRCDFEGGHIYGVLVGGGVRREELNNGVVCIKV